MIVLRVSLKIILIISLILYDFFKWCFNREVPQVVIYLVFIFSILFTIYDLLIV